MQENKKQPRPQNVFLSIILIIVLGFAAYGNSVKNEFIWDDGHLIENNPSIKSWAGLPKIFTEDLGAGSGRRYNFYRPLQTITYMIDHSIWKLDPRGYHLTNILLHILVALCLFCSILLLFSDLGLAVLTGILYVVHPIHTEAVTYISGRADSLALLFMLFCFLLYIRSCSAKNLGIYALMALSYGLALLSKEHSLILPVLLLVYHYSFKKKIKAEAFFLIVGLATLYVVLRVAVLKELLPSGESYNTTFAQRLPGFFVALANYLRLLFLPFGLHMEYGRALFGWKDPRVFWGIVMLVGIVAYALRKKEKSPLIFFAIAWFLIALLPVSNLYGINAYMAEHWLYLPSVGFFLIMAKAIRVLFDNKDLKAFAVFLIAGLVFFYAYLTFRQNTYWREPLGFFERTLAYAPESPAVHYNLGNIYVEANRKEEAIRSYQKAIDLKPRYDEAYNNLGNVYSEIGRWEEGVLSYQKAIEITPDFADAHNNLGLAYFSLRQPEEAIRAYHKAIALKPDYAEAHNNLGVAYAAMNRREEAIASYKKAIGLKPDHANAYFSLGNVYRAMDKREEAAAAYKKATEINPIDAEAYYNLGDVYDLMNKQNEAAAAYKMAVKLNPAYGNPQGDANK